MGLQSSLISKRGGGEGEGERRKSRCSAQRAITARVPRSSEFTYPFCPRPRNSLLVKSKYCVPVKIVEGISTFLDGVVPIRRSLHLPELRDSHPLCRRKVVLYVQSSDRLATMIGPSEVVLAFWFSAAVGCSSSVHTSQTLTI